MTGYQMNIMTGFSVDNMKSSVSKLDDALSDLSDIIGCLRVFELAMFNDSFDLRDNLEDFRFAITHLLERFETVHANLYSVLKDFILMLDNVKVVIVNDTGNRESSA